MKIRHKQSGVELEGEFGLLTDERFTPVRSFFHDFSTGSPYMLPSWQEVEPKWVDVTAGCGVTKDGLTIEHGMLALATVLSTERYRLRKIKMLRAYAPPAGFSSPQYEPVDAFIIEQRQA